MTVKVMQQTINFFDGRAILHQAELMRNCSQRIVVLIGETIQVEIRS